VRGDRAAQHALLLDHIGGVRRIVVRLVGNGPDVDDLVQTACVEALRSLPRFRGDAPFGLWLDRVAAHVVFHFFRSKKRQRSKLELVADTDRRDQSVDHERRLELREATRRARALVDELTPDRRIVFLLVAVEGRTVEEAAALLDVSLAAAKSRYLRARRDIDKRLADRPDLVALLGALVEASDG